MKQEYIMLAIVWYSIGVVSHLIIDVRLALKSMKALTLRELILAITVGGLKGLVPLWDLLNSIGWMNVVILKKKKRK